MSLNLQQQIHVLHVDDEPDFADLTRTFFERQDDRFTVETATSADDGLEMINDRPPDCVVSDYNMPGMDGLEFLQAMREEYPDLPFILFTGKGSETVASEAITAGVTDYLQKGSGSEQYELLANRIRNAVRERRHAEKATRQEELMRLTEFVGDTGGWELDRGSDTIRLTAGIRRIIGRPDQTEISLQDLIELFHPDDREDIQHTLDRAFETGEEMHKMWQLQPDDGDERIIQMNISPVVENGGEVTKLRGAGHDITERKEHERIARHRQKQLSLFFEESPLGAVQWDDDFRFEHTNGRVEEILGYSEAELRGESWELIVADDDRGQVGNAVKKLLDADGGTHVINRNVRKDGEVITCEWHSRPVTDSSGNVQSVFSKFQDVTDRERRKTELQEYETIIGALSDAVYVLDEEGQFTYVNDEFVELVGYDRETILESTPSLIKDETAVERAEQELGRLLSSDGPETVTFEVTIHPREGDPIVCEDHMGILPYEGDQFNGSVGTLRDITEHKEREEVLEQLHASTRELLKTSSPEEVATVGSETAAQVLGLQKSVVLLSDPAADELVPVAWSDETEAFFDESPPSLPIADSLAGQAYRTGEPGMYTDVREAAEVHDLETDFRSELHIPIGDYGVLVSGSTTPGDFDAANKALARVLGANLKVAFDRVERVRKLTRQNERLEEFVSIVSHDLRNPLNRATLGVELAQQESESPHLGDARRGIDRSLALIDDLVTLAREGEQIGPTEPVELEEVVTDAWEMVETEEATLILEADATIQADRSRLRQLLVNLIENAIEHGGADVVVTVDKTQNGFAVEDDGLGIPESDREDVFDAGYSTAESGTGLGLRIVDQVAGGHGWNVSVTDSEDGGARFEITDVDSAEHTRLR